MTAHKAIVATVLSVLAVMSTWGIAAGADGRYEQVELWGLLGLVVAAITGAGTYATRNRVRSNPR